MSKLTLEQLAAMSDGEAISLSKPKQTGSKGPYVNPFVDGKFHAVEITGQDIKFTKNGYAQLELARSVIREDGTMAKAGRVWVNIPYFTDEVASKIDSEKLLLLRQIYGKQLHGILRSADPMNFEVFKDIDKDSKPWKYITRTGKVLTQEEKNARQAQIEAAVIGAAKALVNKQIDLTGTRLYMQEVAADDLSDNKFLNTRAELPSSEG